MDEQVLAGVPLLASLPVAELHHLAGTLARRDVAADTVLWTEGEYGNELLIVLGGRLNVVKALGTPDERLIDSAGPGAYVGEMSLLNPNGRRTASIVAQLPTQLLIMTRDEFDALLQRHPTLAYQVVRVLSERLTTAQETTIRDLRTKNQQLHQANEELRAAQQQIIEKERLEQELKVAHAIQLSILPRTMPRHSDYDFAARLIPARAVGGDFFDFIALPEQQLGIAIGDVTDKGVPAAIFMAQTRALLRAVAANARSPQDALERVNAHLLDMNDEGMFVTVLYGVLDLAKRSFVYVRAGHELPLIYRGGEALHLSQNESCPLGIIPDPPLDEQIIEWAEGQVLILYTDGVTDARAPSGARFGLPRLRQALQMQVHTSGEAICDGIIQAVHAHQADADQYDDVTLVVVTSSASAHS